jgi:hypothetical protein
MANCKFYLAQLPEENQKRVRDSIRMLRSFLRSAESRLARYESDNAEATTDSVLKTIEDLKLTSATPVFAIC